ncbi:MAG: FtsH protease modulator HflK [Pseudomonadota bacterium]|jgi:membrane protease subunit HflK
MINLIISLKDKISAPFLQHKLPIFQWGIVLVVLFISWQILLITLNSFVDIVQQDQKGLYMRLGRYIETVEPGLHFKLPLIDYVTRISVRERQGYIEHIDAMTQDNVIIKISLQYTYTISDPRKYHLDIIQPDQILTEFVQGKLRDIVNAIPMNEVMKNRTQMNQKIMLELQAKEKDYGVSFKLVQIQGTYPPQEVQEAIKQRMVTEEKTAGAKEEALQKKILADANFYDAQKKTEAEKYQLVETAQAKQTAIKMMLEEMNKYPSISSKYLDYLMTQELKSNSKWILTNPTQTQSPDIRFYVDENPSTNTQTNPISSNN